MRAARLEWDGWLLVYAVIMGVMDNDMNQFVMEESVSREDC